MLSFVHVSCYYWNTCRFFIVARVLVLLVHAGPFFLMINVLLRRRDDLFCGLFIRHVAWPTPCVLSSWPFTGFSQCQTIITAHQKKDFLKVTRGAAAPAIREMISFNCCSIYWLHTKVEPDWINNSSAQQQPTDRVCIFSGKQIKYVNCTKTKSYHCTSERAHGAHCNYVVALPGAPPSPFECFLLSSWV